MKKYLLDTNICIYIINDRPAEVKERFRKARIENIFVSPVSIAELYHGVLKSSKPEKNDMALRSFLAFLSVVPFEGDDGHEAGRIRTTLEASGKPIGPYDVLIAAQALVHDLVLVTNNEKEFRRVKGLTVENWAKPLR